MTNCNLLSERIPEALSGAASLSAEEQAHLAGCRACRDEWRVTSYARSLGKSVEAKIDPNRIAAAVLADLTAEPAARKSAQVPRIAAFLAAAAVLLFMVFDGTNPGSITSPPVLESASVLHELDYFEPQELEDFLQLVAGDAATPEFRPIDATDGLGDLTVEELETILAGLEGDS